MADDASVAGVSARPRLLLGRLGGSVILMDLDRWTTISYMMNKMGAGIIGSDRTAAYMRAIHDCLG